MSGLGFEEVRDYQGVAIRLAREAKLPRGMDVRRYLEVVYANFADCFTDRVDFYARVAGWESQGSSVRRTVASLEHARLLASRRRRG